MKFYNREIKLKNLKEIVKRDFNTFADKFLEKYFKEKLQLTKKYSQIGSYWERGNKNEIDIVAVDELNKKLLIAEAKLNKEKINLKLLEQKTKNLLPKFKGYKVEFKAFGLEDM
jgi:AAA+ ATPase superfamily predicted ATPase